MTNDLIAASQPSMRFHYGSRERTEECELQMMIYPNSAPFEMPPCRDSNDHIVIAMYIIHTRVFTTCVQWGTAVIHGCCTGRLGGSE